MLQLWIWIWKDFYEWKCKGLYLYMSFLQMCFLGSLRHRTSNLQNVSWPGKVPWTFLHIRVMDLIRYEVPGSTFVGCNHAMVCMWAWQVATLSWFEPDSTCGSHSIWIPRILALPYLCRFLQCLRQYIDTKDRTCIFNGKDFVFKEQWSKRLQYIIY